MSSLQLHREQISGYDARLGQQVRNKPTGSIMRWICGNGVLGLPVPSSSISSQHN